VFFQSVRGLFPQNSKRIIFLLQEKTMNKGRCFLPVIILLSVSAPIIAAGSADAREVLRKFTEARKNLKSYVVKARTDTTFAYTGFNGVGINHLNSETRYDGNRVKNIGYTWGDINARDRNVKEEDAHYSMNMWDGETAYSYTKSKPHNKGKGTLKITGKDSPGRYVKIASDAFKKTHFARVMGYHIGDTVRIGELFLRPSTELRLRGERGNVNGVDCYVVEADVPEYGKYTVWIDPVHDYHIARIRCRRGPGDRLGTKILKDKAIRRDSFEVLEFEKKGGAWFPKTCKLKRYYTFPGHKSISEKDLTFSMITLNPDHDALGSFLLDDVANGSDVLVRPLPPSMKFVWQDGKVVDKEGNVVLDCMPKKPGDSADPRPESPMKKRPGIWELVSKYSGRQPAASSLRLAERVVHFPGDRTLGKLMIQDENLKRDIKSFFYWTEAGDSDWEYLCQARGDVTVPAGKRLNLSVAKNAWKDLSPLFGLRPDDLHTLTICGPWQGGTLPDDRCIPYIAHLTGLRKLGFQNTRISARGAQSLKQLTNLETLTLSKHVTDQVLAEIVQLTSLKALYLNENRLTNAGLAHLQKLKGLEELSLSGDRINDGALIHIGKLPSLTYLMLQGKTFTDAGMAHLKEVRSLKILHLGHLRQLTDKALVHISEIANLENLTLHWNENITDAGIVHLKKISNLKKLDIVRSKVTVKGVAHLAEIKSIDYVALPGVIMNDEVLSHLGQLHNLRELQIGRPHYIDPKMNKTYYTDRGLAVLAGLKKLEVLGIGSIAVTDEGMSHIAGLTNLRDLNIFGCPITNAGCAKLLALKSLETLYLGHTEMTIAGLSQLSALPKLRELHAKDVKPGRAALDLSGLTNLKKLTLMIDRSSFLSDADLASLANLKKLEWLQTGPRRFTDKGLAHLAGLTEMERLGVGGPELTDEGLRHLANMTKLDHFSIDDGNITDEGLLHLHNLDRLGFINITSRKRISAAAQRRLRESLPDLFAFRVQLKKEDTSRRPARTD
jgi:Leucine-rich repeat (LRR) protein